MAVPMRAVKISARLIERALDTRSRSCASQHSRKVPGFSLLSERLFHGDGFGGCHCRLGRHRLGAL
jgi:hypothetical protein